MRRLLPILAILAVLPSVAFAGHGDAGDPGLNFTPYSVFTPVSIQVIDVEADQALDGESTDEATDPLQE